MGDRVRQGETIAYVGSTGLSTGPHLYYEVRINGRNVDPLRMKLSGGRVLQGDFQGLALGPQDGIVGARRDEDLGLRAGAGWPGGGRIFGRGFRGPLLLLRLLGLRADLLQHLVRVRPADPAGQAAGVLLLEHFVGDGGDDGDGAS